MAEENDLSKKMPEKTEELHKLLVTYLDSVNATTEKTGSKKQVYGLWK